MVYSTVIFLFASSRIGIISRDPLFYRSVLLCPRAPPGVGGAVGEEGITVEGPVAGTGEMDHRGAALLEATDARPCFPANAAHLQQQQRLSMCNNNNGCQCATTTMTVNVQQQLLCTYEKNFDFKIRRDHQKNFL